MIRINDENSLGYSYYLDYDDDDLYYYWDDDDWDDDWYYDVVEDYIDYYYDDYRYDNYYYDNYRYDNYYYDNYYYDEYYYDDYYYYDDDYYYRNRKDRLTTNGDTLKVGSSYNSDIWLNDDDRYSNIRVIDASDNGKDLIIAGNSHNNSIISGDGDTTLYGGGGSSNTLIGSDDDRNVFWYKRGSSDYAVNFITGDKGYSDIIRLSEADCTRILRDDGGIVFNMSDGNFMRLQLKNSNYDDPILYTLDGTNINRMKISKNDTNTLTYRKDTNFYYIVLGGQINVTGSDNAIWLGGENAQTFVNVDTINARQSYGSNVLMGNTNSNVIYGGNGYNTLWGGSGGAADTLISGQGVDKFLYARTEGNDIIYSDDARDVINIYNSTLSDIMSLYTDDYCVQLTFNTGETLTLGNSTSLTPTFQLSDGSQYNFNRTNQSWQNA